MFVIITIVENSCAASYFGGKHLDRQTDRQIDSVCFILILKNKYISSFNCQFRDGKKLILDPD